MGWGRVESLYAELTTVAKPAYQSNATTFNDAGAWMIVPDAPNGKAKVVMLSEE